MKLYLFTLGLLITLCTNAQKMSALEVLGKTITYHDPGSNWSTFNDSLTIKMITPNKPERLTDIHINLPDQSFRSLAVRDLDSTLMKVNKGAIVYPFEELDNAEKYKERVTFMRNYYTYLYGLPMKLQDPNTVLSDSVENVKFKGKDYLRIQTTYKKEVGAEVWYFYLNPENYAMEVYQFFKTDASGKIDPDTGEYILLSEISEISDIKMPKIRKWYYNKNDQFLGTDTIID